MEVHHHPDLHHNKKIFKEYFLEFLMIFLAVTMGFFAENIREHVSEKEKVRGYMKEIVTNLRFDTTRCGLNKITNLTHIAGLDSLRTELKTAIYGEPNTNKLYYFSLLYGYEYGEAVFNSSAMSELKSSGFLRLVDNNQILDQLSDYYERKIFAASNFKPDSKIPFQTINNIFSLMNMDDYIKSFDTILVS